MKHRFALAGALALAVTISSQVQTMGQPLTNGVILISTRSPQDTAAGTEYYTDERGPGMASPGDVEMVNLLGDYGYSCRLVLDTMLSDLATFWPSFPVPADTFTTNLLNPNYAPRLFIASGSGASSQCPPPIYNTNGLAVPEMMGEHVCLGNNLARQGAIYMYDNNLGYGSNDPNDGNMTDLDTRQYMTVVNTTHPIMQGIPLDAQGRVKIWRDPYPEENAHIPTDETGTNVIGKANYEWRWCTHDVRAKAPGTVILGVLSGTDPALDDSNRVCFAVCDVGGQLAPDAPTATSPRRLVQMFMNEQGSGGPRRVFNALTDLGRVLFVRAAKWAMGETLEPYQGLGLIRVSKVGSQQIQLEWEGAATQHYKILGTRNLEGASDLSNWQTVAQDIAVANGTASVKFDVSGAVQYAFLRVAPMQ
jgi:hypothetical protein